MYWTKVFPLKTTKDLDKIPEMVVLQTGKYVTQNCEVSLTVILALCQCMRGDPSSFSHLNQETKAKEGAEFEGAEFKERPRRLESQCQEEGSYTLGRAPAICLGQARIRGPGWEAGSSVSGLELQAEQPRACLYIRERLKSENT